MEYGLWKYNWRIAHNFRQNINFRRAYLYSSCRLKWYGNLWKGNDRIYHLSRIVTLSISCLLSNIPTQISSHLSSVRERNLKQIGKSFDTRTYLSELGLFYFSWCPFLPQFLQQYTIPDIGFKQRASLTI